MKRTRKKKKEFIEFYQPIHSLAEFTKVLFTSFSSFLIITLDFINKFRQKLSNVARPTRLKKEQLPFFSRTVLKTSCVSRKIDKGNRKKNYRLRRFLITAFTAFVLTINFSGINLWWTPSASAAASLTIEPLTWDFVGLDSNNPSVGPDEYLIGARVCNIGSQAAKDIQIQFIREGSYNPYLTVLNSLNTDTWFVPSIAAGGSVSNHHLLTTTPSNCFDAYYNAKVQRTAAAYNTTQRYRIEARASNASIVSTNNSVYDSPHPRQLYVEKILSQGRNAVLGFTGPSNVDVGGIYTFTLTSKTATAYPQLTISSNFPNRAFQFLSVKTTYSNPGVTNSSIYADACGWISDPTYVGYHESSSNCEYPPIPDPYAGGKVGETVTTEYKVKILGLGANATPGASSQSQLILNHLILDFSGGSYHYNSDYGEGGGFPIIIHDRKADLSIDKSHTGNFATGDNTYTLAITNLGPDTAAGAIEVTDTLPTGLTFNPSNATTGVESGTSTGWTCSATGQTISCSNPNNLALSATSTIKLKVNVSSNAATNVVNTATVSPSSTPDPVLTNNTDSDPTTIVKGPNIVLTKDSVPSNAVFVAGSTATYTLSVSNTSGFDAVGPLTIIDTLPTGLTFNSASGTGWNCSANGQNITCTNPSDLNNGNSSSLNIIANVLSNVASSVTNTASATSGSYDTNPADNTNITKTNNTTKPIPDLTVTKTDNGYTFVRSADGIYSITVTNNGVAATTGLITVTDTLPPYVIYKSFSGTNWSCTTNCTAGTLTPERTTPLDVTFTHPGPLAPGQSTSFNITVIPTATSPNSVNNTVVVSTPGDGTSQPKSKTITTPIATAPQNTYDVAVSKTVTTAPTGPGSTIVYQVTVLTAAKGNTDVGGTGIFQDNVPSPQITVTNVTCAVSATATGTGSGTNNCGTKTNNASANNIEYTGFSLKKGGATLIFTITGTVNSSGNITNTASGSPGTGLLDANPADNISTITTAVSGPDLSLTKTNLADFAQGVNGTYRLTVTNVNTSYPTTGLITVTDTLPANLTYVSAASTSGYSGWTCNYDSTSRKLTCTNNNVLTKSPGPGNVSAIDLTVTPTASGSITNSATVSTPGDTNATNDTGTNTITIAAADPDVKITKTAGTLALGQTGTYTIKVQNIGTTVAVAPIVVRDTLPTGLVFVSGTGTGWSCSATGQDVVCKNYSDITSGSSAPDLSLKVLVGSQTAASVNNTATVDQVPSESSAKLANNSSTITTSVGQSSDLGIVKSHTDTFVIGQNAAYQIKVANNGPSSIPTSQAVTFTDTLPNNLSFVSTGSGGDGFTCSASGSTVTCTKTNGLAVGVTANVTLNVNIGAATPTGTNSITNTASFPASILTAVADSNTSNDSSSDPTTIYAKEADLVMDKSHIGTFTIGRQAVYTLQVTNNGPATAVTPTITDNLPSNLSAVSFLGQDWTCSGTTNISCTYSKDLAAKASTAVDVTVSVGSGTPTGTNSITNSATVSSATPDPNSGNNTDSDPTTVVNGADLAVTKTHTGTLAPGTTGSYTITVTNNGPDIAAQNIRVTDYLPDKVRYVSSSSTGGFTCTSDSAASGNTVSCVRNTALGLGSANAAIITLNVEVLSDALSPLVNEVFVGGSPTPDPDVTNNSATDLTSFGPDLTVTKTHTGNFTPGQTGATYAITVRNIGSTATSGAVSLVDDLPSGLIYNSITAPSGWSCTTAANTPTNGRTRITCTTNNSLVVFNASNTAATSYPFTLKVDVASSPPNSVTNTVTVSGGGDTNSTNNTASDPTTLGASQPNLLLVKRITAVTRNGAAINNYNGQALNQWHDDSTTNDNDSKWPTKNTYLRGAISGGVVMPGDEVEYTVYFLSNGASDAKNVTICDLVPTNSTFVNNAFNGSTPRDGGTPSTDSGIALALDATTLPTNPTVYLTNIADAPDRGQFFPPGTTPSTSCSGQNTNGAIVVKVSPNLPHATAPGTPPNSYGFIRFRAKVN